MVHAPSRAKKHEATSVYNAPLLDRLAERWEAIDGASVRKINRVLRERKEAAALIAELLGALKELDAVLGDTPMPDCASINRLIVASSKARDAIAKAEGRQ